MSSLDDLERTLSPGWFERTGGEIQRRQAVQPVLDLIEKAIMGGMPIRFDIEADLVEGPPDVDEKGQRWKHMDDTGRRRIVIDIEPATEMMS